MTTKTPDEIVSQVVLNNYGPEGDAELYETAQSDRQGAEPTTLDLLSAAAWMRDLDADGVRALMVAAVEADRAQRAEQDKSRAQLVEFLAEQLDGYESSAEARDAWANAFPYDAQRLINTVRAAQ